MQDNNADKLFKGRQAKGSTHGQRTKPERMPRGEKVGTSKLTKENVLEIRRKHAELNISGPELAREFGINRSYVWAILNHVWWRHV